MPLTVTPFLMFEGDAGAAMEFYVSLFPDGQILDVVHYGPGEAGTEGSVMHARFRVGGQTVRCIDSPAKHAFTFTPATSLAIECDSEEEIDRLYAALVDGGSALMPIGDYGFSRRFGWVNDKFGVSWQINWK